MRHNGGWSREWSGVLRMRGMDEEEGELRLGGSLRDNKIGEKEDYGGMGMRLGIGITKICCGICWVLNLGLWVFR